MVHREKYPPYLEDRSIRYFEKLVDDYDQLNSADVDIFSVADALGYGVYIINNKGIITHANKHYQVLTGMWEKDYHGKPVTALLDKYFCNTRAVALEALSSGKKSAGLSRPRRTERDLLVTALPVTDSQSGKTETVITLIRDVTAEMELQKQLNRNIERTKLYERELTYYRSREQEGSTILGDSPAMEEIKSLIVQIAPVDTTVLISGETGVGKEVIARELHSRSRRSDKPYIAVNCAAIPESLMESELFGYEKGAFTGADHARKPGFFETANGGTLLLDEVGEIPLPLQSKLLRVLQEREVRRLGGTRSIPVDVRIIAATNRNLRDEVEAGRFRKDLYFRLCVIPLQLPPLRERVEDIPSLLDKFLGVFNRKHSCSTSLSPDAIEVFQRYSWPGNVRELENVVERLVVISRSREVERAQAASVLGIHLEAEGCSEDQQLGLKDAVAALERRMVASALEEHGNSYDAARQLGIDQSTIIRKAQKYGITGWK